MSEPVTGSGPKGETAAPTADATPPIKSPGQAAPAKPAAAQPTRRKRWRAVVVIVVAALVLYEGVPWVWHALHTESTDDAYVNSYVTFVAPRVVGQVIAVLVEDNNRVKKGDVLVELDPEPYRVQLAIRQAELDKARTALAEAQSTARSEVGQARSLRFKLENTIEDVDNQIAVLQARAETLDQAKATLVLAQAEFDRAVKLLAGKVISREEFDEKSEEIDVAKAQVAQSLDSVYQQREALGLPREPPAGKPLTDVPADLDQTFSAVREALFALLQSAGQLGFFPSSYNLTPNEVLAQFHERAPSGNIDEVIAEILKTAPAIEEARADVEVAARNLDQAKLDLSYCTVYAEIDGVITERNVNPGDRVQAGQSLMAIRSLEDIWVDANFKETQLRELRIGQAVKLKVDMYGSKRTFQGRISGFTMGTGSTLSLLPAENATGNFVKVVQRLPVRIDILNYNPEAAPLFVGLSVEPSVYIDSKPTGPNAGQYLQDLLNQPTAKP